MAQIKMGKAARRAGAGSTNTIRRALQAAGIPLVVLSPGTYAVEEEDLERFLQNRAEEKAAGRASSGGTKSSEKPKKPASPRPVNPSNNKRNKRRG